MADEPECGRCRNMLFTAHPVNLSANSFQDNMMRNDFPFVVEVWLPWCRPSKGTAPAFEQTTAQLEPTARLRKLNTDVERDVAAHFGIRNIPGFVLLQAAADDFYRPIRALLGTVQSFANKPGYASITGPLQRMDKKYGYHGRPRQTAPRCCP